MPSATTIALYDGQGTPVSHDFDPVYKNGGRVTYVNRESDTAAGQMQLIVAFDPPKSGRKTTRINIRFNQPVEQTVDGVVRVAYVGRFSADLVLPEEMTQAQRDDFAAFVKNALADTVVNGTIADLDPPY